MPKEPVVVLLRGINLAGRNKLAMEDLRAIAAEAGLDDPRTHVQSGNLVAETHLQPATVRRRIGEGVRALAGIDVEVVTRTAEQWADLIDHNPFADEAAADPKLVHVVLLATEPGDLDLDEAAFAPEALATAGRDVYLSLPGGLGRSKLAQAVDRALSDRCRTTRNWRTVLAVADLLDR